MKFSGLQKISLVDYPDKVASVLFTPGCNLRCPFCHNWRIAIDPQPPFLQEAAALKILESRKKYVDAVVITGGEPCMHKELPKFLAKLKERGFSVKLDTNGFFPDILEECLGKRGLRGYGREDLPRKIQASRRHRHDRADADHGNAQNGQGTLRIPHHRRSRTRYTTGCQFHRRNGEGLQDSCAATVRSRRHDGQAVPNAQALLARNNHPVRRNNTQVHRKHSPTHLTLSRPRAKFFLFTRVNLSDNRVSL